MRVAEAAAYASVSIVFIRKLIQNGKLPAIRNRYYVIDCQDLDACLEELKVTSCQTNPRPPKRRNGPETARLKRSILPLSKHGKSPAATDC